MHTTHITVATVSSAAVLLSISLLRGPLRSVRAEQDTVEKYLFVWAGDQARVKPDFLAVIDFDEYSPDYGNVITTVQLPNPGATGNEPHHVGVVCRWKGAGCRRAAQRFEWSEGGFLLRCIQSEDAWISLLRRPAALCHHGRFLPATRGRLPGHHDG
jgi:hypothetical protein